MSTLRSVGTDVETKSRMLLTQLSFRSPTGFRILAKLDRPLIGIQPVKIASALSVRTILALRWPVL